MSAASLAKANCRGPVRKAAVIPVVKLSPLPGNTFHACPRSLSGSVHRSVADDGASPRKRLGIPQILSRYELRPRNIRGGTKPPRGSGEECDVALVCRFFSSGDEPVRPGGADLRAAPRESRLLFHVHNCIAYRADAAAFCAPRRG